MDRTHHNQERSLIQKPNTQLLLLTVPFIYFRRVPNLTGLSLLHSLRARAPPQLNFIGHKQFPVALGACEYPASQKLPTC